MRLIQTTAVENIDPCAVAGEAAEREEMLQQQNNLQHAPFLIPSAAAAGAETLKRAPVEADAYDLQWWLDVAALKLASRTPNQTR